MTTPRTALGRRALGCLTGLALALLPGLALGEFDRSQRKCVTELNKGLERVASAQGKLNRDCLRQGRLGRPQKLGPGGTIESCLLDDPKLRVARQRQKTIEKAIKKCEPPLPPFGSTDADTVNQAAIEQKLELMHDIFNIDLNESIILKDSGQEGSEQNRTSRCQEEIAIRTDKCMNTRLTEFRRCAKNGIQGGKLSLLYPDADDPFDDPRDIERCLSWDRRSKILSKCEVMLDSKVNARCPDFTRELAAPGGCHDAADIAGCLDRLVRCRTCIAVNQADDLSTDCDLFDDCRTNGTCPPVLPICGDEIIQVAISEECDDGDTDDGDGCSASCQLEPGAVCPSERAEPSVCGSSCGNGVLEESESCDDGNQAGGDGCDSHCDFERGAVCQRGGSGPSVCVFSCGNGITDEDECCDDGNLTDGDGCTANCQLEEGYACDDIFDSCEPICGDGLVRGSEECDDRDKQDADGCSSNCQLEPGFVCHEEDRGATIECELTCGNENLDPGEGCDDGNLDDGDGCSSHCQLEPGAVCQRPDTGPDACLPSCGNGSIDSGEECDDGNLSNGDGCSENCQIESGYSCAGEPSGCDSVCGDGFVRGSENCDDRGTEGGDGCSSTCELEPGWSCEEGSLAPSQCVFSCGNGDLDPDEGCDDANLDEGDGCNDNCQVEPTFVCSGEPSVCVSLCGNGAFDPDEDCDDGNRTDGDGCSAACQIEQGFTCSDEPGDCDPICGDGLVRGDEECDDGGTAANDGCDGSCRLEPGAICTGGETGPSVCVLSCGNGVIDPNEVCDDGGEVFDVTLNGASVVPPVQTIATAIGRFSLDSQNALIYTVIATDIEAVNGAQIRLGAPGDNGSTVFTLEDAPRVSSGITRALIQGELNQLRAGLYHLIIPTQAHPDGEIRGQLVNGLVEAISGDGCSDRCQLEMGFSCEGEPSSCEQICGDGFVVGTEECDDAGTLSGDGCSSSCALEPGAVCQGAPSVCVFSCGNGVLDAGESCDDGNTSDGDGCSDNCQSESTPNDADADGIVDPNDNCPFATNPGQADSGAMGSEPPDGVGDACQCGDVTGDGIGNSADSTMILRQSLGLSAPSFNMPGNCDVTGEGDCNSADATLVLRRSLNLDAPAFGNHCPNFTGGL